MDTIENNERDTFPVSFCVIASMQDMHDSLQGMLRSLPKNAEVCIVLNEPGKESHISELAIHEDENRTIRSVKWTYQKGKFDFSFARNLCNTLATKDWIFWMDCDEYLVEQQHEGIAEATVRHGGGVGGFMCGQASLSCYKRLVGEAEENEYFNIGQLRMYRNTPEFKWEGYAHEQIAHTIRGAGYSVIDTTITIAHNGYSGDPEKLRKKLERNTDLIGRWLADNTKEHGLYKFYRDTHTRDITALIKMERQ